MTRRLRQALLAGTALSLAAAPASAAPVVGFFAAAFTAVNVAPSVASFVIGTAISFGVSKLLAPKAPKSNQERQASVLSLSLGEGPREAIFGRAATGGSLLDAFNFGGTNGTDWEVLVIKVADHLCDALEGFYVGDTYYSFGGDGAQSGFGGQLEVYWKNGDPAQTASSYLVTNSASRLYGTPWTSADVAAGMAYVVAAYKADAPNASSPVWPQGRPSFKWLVRGKRCYDPRLDSTVAGGSGAHRWSTPSTWAWTENARICDYNYDRGIYAKDQVSDPTQLLIGRGLSALEADPTRVFAAANLCDEDVPLKAGGTEKRYRVGGVVYADESFIAIKERFAAAMAGDIVKRGGGVVVEPGAAKSTVAEITDADLVIGEPVGYEPFVSDADRINTVVPRYIEPAQLWKDHGAPVRRSTSDITTDGGLKSEDLSLALVTSGPHAQRCGEIRRRLARKERRATLVLPPTFSHLEDGDWIGWTSSRYFAGTRVVFRIEGVTVRETYRTQLVLREIGSDAYSWTASTDEGTPGEAPIDEAGALPALALSGVSIVETLLVGDNGNATPAVKATWTTPVDPAISGVRLEVRRVSSATSTVSTTNTPNAGQLVTTDGVIGDSALEGRVIPISVDGRRVTASSWTALTTQAVSIGTLSSAFADGDLTPGEKLWVIPAMKALIGARSALRAQADLENLVYGYAAARTNFEDAATALDSMLAALTSPVAWDDASDVTTVGSPSTFRTTLENAWKTERVLQATLDYILSIKKSDSKNLWRKQDWFVAGGATNVTPSYGVSGWGYTLPAATAGAAVKSTHGGFGPLAQGHRYTLTFLAKATGGTCTVRVKFRSTGGAAMSDLADKVFTITTTAVRQEWVSLGSDDANWPTAVLSIQEDAGDIPSGRSVEITDIKLTYGDQVTEWTPSPDDPELLRIATYVGELNADKTSTHTAAAITGQGALATLNQATWATQVTGTGKPEDFATKSLVYKQASAPSSPVLNDIWVQLDGLGNPLAMYAWNGSVWINGADRTIYNTAAAITGQGSWATASVPSGLTPTVVNGRTQYLRSDGQIFDYRGMIWGYSVDGVAGRYTQPLTPSSGAVSCSAHTVYLYRDGYSTGFPISVPSASFSGLSADLDYSVFYRPNFGDFSCHQSDNDPAFRASEDGWMWIGTVRTPTSGGTYTPPTSGFSGIYLDFDCIAETAFLADGRPAAWAEPGDPLVLLAPSGDHLMAGRIAAAVRGEAACLTFETAGGAVLTLSVSTPIMTRAGEGWLPVAVRADAVAPGAAVPILRPDGRLAWDQVARITPAGVLPVVKITAAGPDGRALGIYAAGDRPQGPMLLTHNGYNKV